MKQKQCWIQNYFEKYWIFSFLIYLFFESYSVNYGQLAIIGAEMWLLCWFVNENNCFSHRSDKSDHWTCCCVALMLLLFHTNTNAPLFTRTLLNGLRWRLNQCKINRRLKCINVSVAWIILKFELEKNSSNLLNILWLAQLIPPDLPNDWIQPNIRRNLVRLKSITLDDLVDWSTLLHIAKFIWHSMRRRRYRRFNSLFLYIFSSKRCEGTAQIDLNQCNLNYQLIYRRNWLKV